ncbi:glycoside hydrolase family 16 protein [Imleria badia]|nr:glycoside hydrolase family 16 protein [Imleria badia]
MHLPTSAVLISLLFAVPLVTLVAMGAQNIASRPRNEVDRGSAAKTYALQDWYQDEDFFSHDATSQGFAYVNLADNTFVMAVDSTSTVPSGGKRNSVRITSDNVYDGGLFVLDAAAMPVGCDTWPSFWTSGPNWPMAGEIDIVEGINDQANNQMTLYSGTSNPCTIDVTASKETFTGQVLGTSCYSTETADAGCPILDTDTRSSGYEFNGAQGGVFALLWNTSAGMSMWHFARGDIPADITNKMPTPANWGTPAGFWSPTTCDIADNFYDHSMIIDTTICGGWAGGAYGISGCPGTCSDMVANATNFADAKWVINYLAVYQ